MSQNFKSLKVLEKSTLQERIRFGLSQGETGGTLPSNQEWDSFSLSFEVLRNASPQEDDPSGGSRPWVVRPTVPQVLGLLYILNQ